MELTLTSLTALWPDPLPSGAVGIPYSYPLTASGAVLPESFASGALPAGLSLNGSIISGVPTVATPVGQPFAVTLSVTDSSTGTVMNPSKAVWIEPTNPDGTAIATGEITGYTLGIRLSTGT